MEGAANDLNLSASRIPNLEGAAKEVDLSVSSFPKFDRTNPGGTFIQGSFDLSY